MNSSFLNKKKEKLKMEKQVIKNEVARTKQYLSLQVVHRTY